MNRYKLLDAMFDLVEKNIRNAILDQAIEAVKYRYKNSKILTTESMYPAIEAIEAIKDRK